METIKVIVNPDGSIAIPQDLLSSIGIMVGDEVKLLKDGYRVVIEPMIPRKRLFIRPEIIDRLIEAEAQFNPEGE